MLLDVKRMRKSIEYISSGGLLRVSTNVIVGKAGESHRQRREALSTLLK